MGFTIHPAHFKSPDTDYSGCAGEVGKILGEKWKDLSDKEKKPYEDRAKADKERYEAEKARYAAVSWSPSFRFSLFTLLI